MKQSPSLRNLGTYIQTGHGVNAVYNTSSYNIITIWLLFYVL